MATETIESRVSNLEEMIGDIPRLLNLRFSYVRAQLDALDARMNTVEAKLDRLANEFHGLAGDSQDLRSQVKALPRVIAEMLDERDRRRG